MNANPIDATLDLVAEALAYPRLETRAAVLAAAGAITDEADSAAHRATSGALGALATWLSEATPGEPEERYSLLFDLSPVCTLNLGYHVFGESYERGALLAGLTGELRQVGLDPGDELPDHLTNILRLLARLPDPQDRVLLLAQVLLPALRRVRKELKDGRDPWTPVLVSLPELLTERATRQGLALEAEVVPPRRLHVISDQPGANPYGETEEESHLSEVSHA